ncbi:MAG: Tim44 domain-containing protein, partial [Rhodospirillales bacterium]
PGAVSGPAAGGGGFARSPLMTGILGGFLGAGLFGLIFSNPAWAAEGSQAGGMVGLMLQFALIVGAAWLGFMLLRRMLGAAPSLASAAARSPASAGARFPASAGTLSGAGAGTGSAAPRPGPEVTAEDQRAFGEVLAQVQQAWSDGDLVRLRRLATPEMAAYFAEDLADATSRGVRNAVEGVELLKGDVVDHWAEGDRQYATAVMTWRASDYLVRDGAPAGDKSPSEATEAWTFMRAGGGKWLLSAIQQV